MSIEQTLYQAAMCTEDGQTLTSVSPGIIDASTELCIEKK